MSTSEVPGLEGGVELKGHTHSAPEGEQESTTARDSPHLRYISVGRRSTTGMARVKCHIICIQNASYLGKNT